MKNPKVMIDVGAHYGGACIPFIKDGWQVWALEPDRQNRTKLVENLAKHKVSVMDIDDRALSNKIGKSEFFISDISTGISGLLQFHDSHHSTYEVETITFNQYLEEKKIQEFDFLKIDTEGYDLFVLQGLNLHKYSPHIIMCEFEDNKTQKLSYTIEDMINYLEEFGYQILISEWYPIKEYGKRHKWKKFTRISKNIDSASWGNIIATKKENMPVLIKAVEKTTATKVRI